MNKRKFSGLFFFLSTLTSALAFVVLAHALDVPPLTGRVVDLAHVLPTDTIQSLTAQLAAHESQSSNQVAVLILPSLAGESLEEFSHRVATTWKLGRKGTDNGVLLLIAIGERKIRIEVGYGLEGVLTDIRSAHIIRDEIVPRFRAGDVPGGVTAGVNAIVSTIDGTYQATPKLPSPQANDVISQVITAVVVGVVVGLVLGNVYRWIGPAVGAGVSVLLAPWVLPAIVASGATLLLLVAIGVSGIGGGGGNRYRGLDDWVWYRSRGGGWGGGSFGGGGGFSGGGGDFGGGGASGNW